MQAVAMSSRIFPNILLQERVKGASALLMKSEISNDRSTAYDQVLKKSFSSYSKSKFSYVAVPDYTHDGTGENSPIAITACCASIDSDPLPLETPASL